MPIEGVSGISLRLVIACCEGTVDQVREAIAEDADVNIRIRGLTPLQIVVMRGRGIEFMRALLKAGVDLSIEPGVISLLHCMVGKGNAEGIRLLRGRRGLSYEVFFDDLTPLMMACSLGETAVTEALIDGGAELETITRGGGRTALYLAVANNKPETARVLLQRSARVSSALSSSIILDHSEETQEIRDLIAAHVRASDPVQELGSTVLGVCCKGDEKTS